MEKNELTSEQEAEINREQEELDRLKRARLAEERRQEELAERRYEEHKWQEEQKERKMMGFSYWEGDKKVYRGRTLFPWEL